MQAHKQNSLEFSYKLGAYIVGMDTHISTILVPKKAHINIKLYLSTMWKLSSSKVGTASFPNFDLNAAL